MDHNKKDPEHSYICSHCGGIKVEGPYHPTDRFYYPHTTQECLWHLRSRIEALDDAEVVRGIQTSIQSIRERLDALEARNRTLGPEDFTPPWFIENQSGNFENWGRESSRLESKSTSNLPEVKSGWSIDYWNGVLRIDAGVTYSCCDLSHPNFLRHIQYDKETRRVVEESSPLTFSK